MKERKQVRRAQRTVNEWLNDGLAHRCVCGAKVTCTRSSASGSIGYLHPFPVCQTFEQTGVPLRTC